MGGGRSISKRQMYFNESNLTLTLLLTRDARCGHPLTPFVASLVLQQILYFMKPYPYFSCNSEKLSACLSTEGFVQLRDCSESEHDT